MGCSVDLEVGRRENYMYFALCLNTWVGRWYVLLGTSVKSVKVDGR